MSSSDRPLSDYRPDPREVIGLAAFPADGLLSLVAGRQAALAAGEAVSVGIDGRLSNVEVVVERTDLVPYSVARLRRMLRPSSAALIQFTAMAELNKNQTAAERARAKEASGRAH